MASVLFIDGRVADLQRLIDGLGADVEVVVLDPAVDGLAQMASHLGGRSGIDAIHVVSHAAAGSLLLGDGVLDAAGLRAHAAELATIGASLSASGDLLLYGCDLASGDAGAEFIGTLAELTGADVAASDDPTGAAARGGDWLLEARTGAIEAAGLAWRGYEDLLAVITGDDNANNLVGTAADDWIYGLGGDDSIAAGDGSDSVDAGTGNDTIDGGAGNDLLYGYTGNDVFIGSSGQDSLYGEDGDDVFNLNSVGNVTGWVVNGGAGYDVVDLIQGVLQLGSSLPFASVELVDTWRTDFRGTVGNNFYDFRPFTTFSPGFNLPSEILVYGGAGNDTIYASNTDLAILASVTPFDPAWPGWNRIYGEDGNDSLYGGASVDWLYGGNDNDYLDGGGGRDTLDGGAGNDTVHGGAGNDQFAGSAGVDAMYGDDGNDVFDLNAIGNVAGWVVDGGTGSDTVDLIQGVLQLGTTLPFTAVEVVDTFHTDFRGTVGNDVYDFRPFSTFSPYFNLPAEILVYAGAGDDTVYASNTDLSILAWLTPFDPAWPGWNRLYGEGGNDNLYGGASVDWIHGGSGNDFIDGGAGNDTLDGGGGNDTTYGGDGNDYIYAVLGGDSIVGGTGNDTLDTTSYGGHYAVNLTTGTSNFAGESFTELENIVSGGGNDTLTGTSGNNLIRGGLGDDLLVGTAGVDSLYGEAGSDGFDLNAVTDLTGWVIDGGDGDDGADMFGGGNVQLGSTLPFVAVERIDTLGTVFVGTAGNDSYDFSAITPVAFGGAYQLVLHTGDGNDTVVGTNAAWAAGWHVLDGGNGNDSLRGGASRDSLLGGAGNDTLDGGGGSDFADAGAGDDYVYAVLGSDSAEGGTGNDTLDTTSYGGYYAVNLANGLTNFLGESYTGFENLVSGAGNDTLIGTVGANRIEGGAGADSIIGDDGNDTLDGGVGNDTLWGGGANDVVQGGSGWYADHLYGGDGDDTLDGGGADDYLDGGAGQDWVYATEGNVTALGGDGIDTVSFAPWSMNLQVNLSTGFVNWGSATYSGFENLMSGAGNDTLHGTGGDNAIFGGDGNDQINGNGGRDSLFGDAGDDSFDLNAVIDLTGWVVDGGSGTDTADLYDFASIQLGTALPFIGVERLDNWGALFLGTAGADYYDFSPITTIAFGLESQLMVDTGDGNDTLIGTNTAYAGVHWLASGAGNDSVTGGTSRDSINGGTGDDVLHGGAGYAADSLYGGDGNDTLDGDGGNDYADAGAGDDLVYAAFGTDTAVGGDGNDTLDTASYNGGYAVDLATGSTNFVGESFTGFENLLSGAGNDTLGGTAGANFIAGRAGADSITGGGGNDTLVGGEGNDTLVGGTGDDELHGGDGDDLLVGDATSADFMYGEGGNDSFDLNTVNDLTGRIIDGGSGTDTADLVDFGVVQLGTSLPFVDIEQLDTLGTTFWGTVGSDSYDFSGITTIAFGGAYRLVLYTFDGNDTVVGTDAAWSGGLHYIDVGAGDDHLTGGSSGDWLEGGAGSDRLHGGSGFNADRLNGGAGNDTLDAGGGNDYTDAGAGDDYVYAVIGTDTAVGGDGNDTLDTTSWAFAYAVNLATGQTNFAGESFTGFENLVSGAGNDTLVGTAGANLIRSGNGADSVSGDDGNDTLEGEAGADTLQGGGGDDTLDGGTGADSLVGGDGGDVYVVDDAGDVVDEGGVGGRDAVWTELASTVLGATIEDGRILSAGAADLTGNALDNVLYAGDGDNVLDGGLGTDTASYRYASAAVSVSLDAVGIQPTGGSGNDTLISIEVLEGSNYGDVLTGNALGNRLYGGAGADTLDGGLGADTLAGGVGDDVYVFSASGDVAVEGVGEGTDEVWAYASVVLGANVENARILTGANVTVVGNALNNVLVSGSGNNALSGGGGTDTASYELAGAGVTVSLGVAGAQVTGGSGSDALAGIENLRGSDFNDALTGNAGANVLDGGSGNDTLDGAGGTDTVSYASAAAGVVVSLGVVGAQNTVGAGVDTLVGMENVLGGAFNDALTGDAGANVLDGGLGNDTLDGAGGADTASYASAAAGVVVSLGVVGAQNTVGAGVDTLVNIENLLGSAHDDTLVGGAGAEVIDGGLGDDALDGGAGVDTVSYASAAGAVVVNLALGTASGAAGNDTLANFEYVKGGAYADHLTGDAGNNVIDGGNGADTMAGGAGNDVYLVNSSSDVVVEQADEGTDEIHAYASVVLGANVENVRILATTNASVVGNTLDNVIMSGVGDNSIAGGAGTDTVSYVLATSAVTVSLAVAGAQATGGSGSDALAGVENLTGSNYNDSLTGNAGANVIEGGLGNDTLDGAGGVDTVSYGKATGAVTVNLALGTATGAAGNDSLSNFENATGGAYNDVLTGNAGANVLDGGLGVDTMAGGAGDDVYVVNSSSDVVTEGVGEGTDEVYAYASVVLGANVENARILTSANASVVGNGLDNVIVSGAGSNSLAGGAGTDTVSYVLATSGVTVSLAIAGVQATGGSGSDTLTSVENLTGSSFNDSLTGNAGNNVIDGGLGVDTMAGGAGNDIYVVNSSSDVVIEGVGEGADEVYAYASVVLGANVENVRILTSANASVVGNGLDNVIVSGAGNNILGGGGGTDTVSYELATSAVTVSLGIAIAQATGGSGSDTLASIENLTGSNYNDSLTGNAGANVIDGGSGSDTLAGGAGADTFVLGDLIGSETITDFVSGTDKLSVAMSRRAVGDGDQVVENAATIAGPGGFATNAELVVVTGNIAGAITAASAAAAIGSANANYAVGQTALFLVDNGVDSALYVFSALNGDAVVSAAELTLLASLTGTTSTTTTDLIFGP